MDFRILLHFPQDLKQHSILFWQPSLMHNCVSSVLYLANNAHNLFLEQKLQYQIQMSKPRKTRKKDFLVQCYFMQSAKEQHSSILSILLDHFKREKFLHSFHIFNCDLISYKDMKFVFFSNNT